MGGKMEIHNGIFIGYLFSDQCNGFLAEIFRVIKHSDWVDIILFLEILNLSYVAHTYSSVSEL